MRLIDKSYFKGEIALPEFNTGSVGVGRMIQTVGEQSLDDFIDSYQTEYLNHVLGLTLCKHFLEGLGQDSPLQIWIDLKERLTTFYGQKESPIAYYVYYFIRQAGESKTTIVGEKKGKITYGQDATYGVKMQYAWRKMVQLTGVFNNWLFSCPEYRDYMCGHRRRDFLLVNTFGI